MKKFKNVDTYIAAAPRAVQPTLRGLRKTIRDAIPGIQEGISYGMPYYSYHGRLAYWALAKAHIGVYALFPDPATSPLRKYIAGKGTLRFPLDKKMPLSQIKKQVIIRARQNKERKNK